MACIKIAAAGEKEREPYRPFKVLKFQMAVGTGENILLKRNNTFGA